MLTGIAAGQIVTVTEGKGVTARTPLCALTWGRLAFSRLRRPACTKGRRCEPPASVISGRLQAVGPAKAGPTSSRQKSNVTLNRANRGLSTAVGRSHVAPSAPKPWLNAVPTFELNML